MSMHGSSLDPYTRLLASVADAVTKARQSFPKTVSGKLILLGIFSCVISLICLFALFTSIFWGPVLMVTIIVYMSLAGLRYIIDCSSDVSKRVKLMSIEFLNNLVGSGRRHHISDDYIHQQQTQAAIKDHGFLRTIFEALPGVDAERAIERVPKLNSFRLTMHETFNSAIINRSPTRNPDALRSPSPGKASDSRSPCLSPMQLLFDKGLLAPVDADWQMEEQASWQVTMPLAPAPPRWTLTTELHRPAGRVASRCTTRITPTVITREAQRTLPPSRGGEPEGGR